MTLRSKWNKYWRERGSLEEHSSFYGKWLRRQRLKILEEILSCFPRSYSVLEIGCGSGELLQFIKGLGFKYSVGIDYSVESIWRCVKRGFVLGKDVFHVDVKDVHGCFDVVVAEGVWEHYPPSQILWIIEKTASLSSKYVLALQPNHYSVAGAFLKVGGLLFSRVMRELKEYSYPFSFFVSSMSDLGFECLEIKYTKLHEQGWLIFRRMKI